MALEDPARNTRLALQRRSSVPPRRLTECRRRARTARYPPFLSCKRNPKAPTSSSSSPTIKATGDCRSTATTSPHAEPRLDCHSPEPNSLNSKSALCAHPLVRA